MWPELIQVKGLEPIPIDRHNFDKSELDLPELVAKRLFTDAIDRSLQLLKAAQEPQTDAELGQLLYIWLQRFRCLLAIKQGARVAQEAQTCMSVLDQLPMDVDNVWELRLLLVPVWAKGINQTAILMFYKLAAEARVHLMEDHDSKLWDKRIRDVGLYVAAALVGMKDYNTALAHLASIYAGESYANAEYATEIARLLAVTCLFVGDTEAAKKWAEKYRPDGSEIFMALFWFSERQLDKIITTEWKEETPDLLNIKALAYLHTGQVQKCIDLLEKIALEATSSSVLYNLFMTYDLVERVPSVKKQEMAEKFIANGTTVLGNYDLF